MSDFELIVDRTLAANPHADTLAPTATIVPSRRTGQGSVPELAEPVRFQMGETLGEGGMGVVRVAEQVALNRTVAVKSLRGEKPHESLVRKLLEEAWITGTLEHPNVVPVYDIDTDELGRPLIVLKKIDGRAWDELMHDGAEVKRLHGQSDLLEWNLRVLIQVCHALRYAHGRGIVHRDVKPENVMLGEFGEVYLLDWGIAVAMHDESGKLPLVQDATQMAGTPCYMAPEMLGGATPRLGPWTDVYLSGAVLFEIVTGRVPHEGDDLRTILRSVLTSPPEVPGQVPEELARIIVRAMDPDPDARFENLDQVRLALEGFLTHRGSRTLVRRAEQAEAGLVEAIASADMESVDERFAECRFGYRAALEAWSGNEEAEHALLRVTLRVVEAELDHGDADAAARLIAAIDAPDDVKKRVERAREQKRSERALADAMMADADESLGQRTRAYISAIMGVIWTLAPIVHGVYGASSNAVNAGISAAMALFTTSLFYWARESLSRSAINRGLVGLTLVCLVGQTGMLFGAHVADWSPLMVEQVLPLLWFFTIACGVVTIHRSIWPGALAMGASFGVGVAWPEARYVAASMANFFLLLNLLYINRTSDVLKTMIAERRSERSS